MGAPGDRNADRLPSDRRLRTVKVFAGLVSVALLIGLFLTSLNRAPDPAWTFVLAITALVIVVGIALAVRRWLRR